MLFNVTNQSSEETMKSQKTKLAIFDMDGTLFESYLNWSEIRKQLEIKQGASILSEIYDRGEVDTCRLEILENFEKENTMRTRPISGISGFLKHLKNQNIRTALITNNNSENTDYLLKKYRLNFELVITREQRLWKPSPDALLYAMKEFDCRPAGVVSIGDSHYDIKSSRAAGISLIYIISTGRSFIRSVMDDTEICYFDDYHHLSEILTRDNIFRKDEIINDVDMSTSFS
jgi:HAD superfamily hydrolase (TIGR01509 family)